MVIHQSFNSTGTYYYDPHVFRSHDFPPHFHRSYEVIHVICGQLEVIVDGRKELLNEGDFALCLTNEVHTCRRIGPTRYFVCVFSADFVPEFHKTMEGKTAKSCKFRIDGSILSFLQEHILYSKKVLVPPFHQQVAATNLICGEYLRQAELMERNNKEYALMNTIADYIGSHYQEDLHLKDVAAVLGYDYYYFSRLFYQIFSMKFSDYLSACRCAHATDALLSTDKPITQIALESGFQSIRSFNDVFLRKVGLSPAQYRKQLSKLLPI